MKQETEINIKIRESRTNEKGIIKVDSTIELECLNCGCSYEMFNDHRNKQDVANNTRKALAEIISDYINDGFLCEDCQKGESND